jgi:hypothetical protein
MGTQKPPSVGNDQQSAGMTHDQSQPLERTIRYAVVPNVEAVHKTNEHNVSSPNGRMQDNSIGEASCVMTCT